MENKFLFFVGLIGLFLLLDSVLPQHSKVVVLRHEIISDNAEIYHNSDGTITESIYDYPRFEWNEEPREHVNFTEDDGSARFFVWNLNSSG